MWLGLVIYFALIVFFFVCLCLVSSSWYHGLSVESVEFAECFSL